MVKEIFFHYSEFKGDLEALQAGDDVEFTIKDRNVGTGSSLCKSLGYVYIKIFSDLRQCVEM